MKKLLGILIVVFFLCSTSFAEDVSKLEIEGISIGDSLLDHISKQEIITEIEINKIAYNHLTDDFGEVYLFGNFDIYERLSFFVKPKDRSYSIYFIKGSISYDDNVERCYAKQKEIAKEFSLLYKNVTKREETLKFEFDPTGKSTTHNIKFVFDSGDYIAVNCTKYEKNLKIKHKWLDSLQVAISKKEIVDWFNNPIN